MQNKKEEILKAYNFRHACKKFDENKKVTKEDFDFILETGRLSPSSFGFEPWKFLVVQNPELKGKIKSVSWGTQGKIPEASHFVVILARKKSDMIYNSEYITHIMREVQHIPEDIIDNRKKSFENFEENDFKLLESDRAIFDWACKQTYIALGNMMTAAAQIGIDSCPIEGFNRDKLGKILENEGVLDRNKFGVSVMVAFGYRKANPRPKTRQAINEIVQWI